MEARKEIATVLPKTTLSHQGDLTITGNIEPDAILNITNGSLTVLGNIGSGARIYLKSSPSFKNAQCIIHGSLQDFIVLNSAGDIEIRGSIGNNCWINSLGHLTAQEIGEDTNINILKNINITQVGNKCVIYSQDGSLKAMELKDNVGVIAKGNVQIQENIGNGCKLKSYGKLSARDIGERTNLMARGRVQVRNVNAHSLITSILQEIKAHHVKNNVTLNGKQGVYLHCVDNACQIKCKESIIHIAKQMGDDNKLIANKDIYVDKIGNQNNIFSKQGKIIILGSGGDSNSLEAKDTIEAKKMGDHVIISCNASVNLKKIGANGLIKAKDGIEIEGLCGPNTQLRTQGMIRKNIQVSYPSQIEQNYFTGDYEGDLKLALELSNEPSVRKVGLFSQSKQKLISIAKPIVPEAFYCPITQEMMREPVICKLDGCTYEQSFIAEWLTQNRTSPINRVKMAENELIENVLIPNRNLKQLIDEFYKQNPDFGLNNNNPTI